MTKSMTTIKNPQKQLAHATKIDDQFGLNLMNGIKIKPKFKRIKNLSSGNTSVLFNANNRRLPSDKDIDLDVEALKLKVCIRKELEYQDVKLEEMAINKEARSKFNEKKRKKLIFKVKEKHPNLISILKNNAKILNNWVSYVVGALPSGSLEQDRIHKCYEKRRNTPRCRAVERLVLDLRFERRRDRRCQGVCQHHWFVQRFHIGRQGEG